MTQLSVQGELDLFNIDKGPPLLLSPLPPFSKCHSWRLGFLLAYFVCVKKRGANVGEQGAWVAQSVKHLTLDFNSCRDLTVPDGVRHQGPH